MHSFPTPRLCDLRKTFLLLVALTAFVAVSCLLSAKDLPVAIAATPALSTQPFSELPAVAPLPKGAVQTEPTQVADEIIRRLRRLGINFSKTRILRPYDPDGYVC